MAVSYLSLGTNLGNKKGNLDQLVVEIEKQVGHVLNVSKYYSSKPWGFNSSNDFLNAVVAVQTFLSPIELLEKTQIIEKKLGRTTKSVNGYSDRLIDIDILLYDNLIIAEPTLKIPHPLITVRDFVLIPLVEIAPDIINPVTGLKYSEFILQV